MSSDNKGKVFAQGLWNSGNKKDENKEQGAQYFQGAPVLGNINQGKYEDEDEEVDIEQQERQQKINTFPDPLKTEFKTPFQNQSNGGSKSNKAKHLAQKNQVREQLEQQNNQGRPKVTFDPEAGQGGMQKADQRAFSTGSQDRTFSTNNNNANKVINNNDNNNTDRAMSTADSLKGKSSAQLEREPLYYRGASRRMESSGLTDMPIDYLDQKMEEQEPKEYQKPAKKLDDDAVSQNSSQPSDDHRGVFYPNPIEDMEDAKIPKKLYKNKFTVQPDSLLLFLFYICALVFYSVIRIRFSLDLGNYIAYGWIMWIVEVCGGMSIAQFSFLGIFRCVGNKIKWDPGDPLTRTQRKYHIRVLIPCFKENLEIVSHTVMACYYAPIPVNCQKTIYVLDDGNDPSKEKWVAGINSENIVYLSHRKKLWVQMKDKRGNPILKPNGTPMTQYAEVNGKAENLNNAVKNYIYKDLKPEDIPLTEMVCIMDADQVACRAFFMRMVPLFDSGENVAMVFSPQCFYNTPPYSDIFNHSNLHFWEYILPGADAIQTLYCPGSNVLIRSQALCQAGWMPTNSVTEDFVLGMKLCALGHKFRYVREYLAVGEAPETLVQCLQQKSRWCKGHWQILFNVKDSPFTLKGLNPLQRLIYIMSLYNYLANVLNAIFFFAVPVIAIWFGIFPLIIDQWVAIGMSVYYAALLVVKYYCRVPRMWVQVCFASIATFALTFTYMKAIWNGAWASATGRLKTFKVTEKKDTSKKASSLQFKGQFLSTMRLLWPYWIFFYVQLISLIFALIWVSILYNTESKRSLNMTLSAAPAELALSIVWIFYNFLPYYLVIHFTYFGSGTHLNVACLATIVIQILAYIGVILAVWLLLSIDFPYGQLLDDSMYYIETLRSGYLRNNSIPTRVDWRGDSTTYDGQDIGIDLVGGIYGGGQYGYVKATLPIAFTSTMIAWTVSMWESVWQSTNNYNYAINQIKWNNEYLGKTVLVNEQRQPYGVVLQVGKAASENSYWGRPEDLDQSRPVYTFLQSEGGADVAAQLSAAFASSYKILKYNQPGLAMVYSQQAQVMYQYMNASQNAPLYNTKNPNTINLVYTQNTTYDDFMWAAAWMFEAYEDPIYLQDFLYFRSQYLNKELDPRAYYLQWDFVYWGADMLVAKNPKAKQYLKSNMDDLKKEVDAFWYKQVCKHFNQYLLLGFNNLNDTASNQNPQWPRKLGTLAADAFLAMIQSEHSDNPAQAVSYFCWAEDTIRAMLGENTLLRNFVGGYTNPDKINVKRQWDRASSCPPPPQICDRLNNQYTIEPNPHVLKGSLAFTFGFYDDRTNPANLVSLENNIGYTALLVGLQHSQYKWNQCWRVQSLRFRKHPICGNYGWTTLQNGQNGPIDDDINQA